MSTNIFGNEFFVGINKCWLSNQYDHDFGHNMLSTTSFYNNPYQTIEFPDKDPIDPYVETEDGKKSQDNLFLRLGSVHNVEVIRVWAFERFEAIKFGDQLDIVGIDENFLNNIETLLNKAKDNDVKIYLCLFDAWPIYKSAKKEFGLEDKTDDEIALLDVETKKKIVDYENLQEKWKECLERIVKDFATQDDFFVNVMDPLMRRIGEHENLFGIDIFNEPESLIQNDSEHFSEADVIKFVRAVSNHLKGNFNVNISCGFKDFSTIKNNINELSNLDFFDFHSYQEQNNFNLETYAPEKFGGKDCIIGECGYPLHLSNSNERENRQVLKKFFDQSVSKGYSGILPWISDYTNSQELLDDTIEFSMTFPIRKNPKPENEDKKCFIATAAIGTSNDSRIYFLREYRKFVLKKSRFKKLFEKLLSLYFVASPPIAKVIRNYKLLRFLTIVLFVQPLLIIVKSYVKLKVKLAR